MLVPGRTNASAGPPAGAPHLEVMGSAFMFSFFVMVLTAVETVDNSVDTSRDTEITSL